MEEVKNLTSKERVKACVNFTNPDQLPIYYFNRDQQRSDILRGHYDADPAFSPDVPGRTEWGFRMTSLDDTFGQPEEGPFEASLEGAEAYRIPNPHIPERYQSLRELAERHPDRYLIASLGISGFGTLTSLRGFTNTLMDLYLDRDAVMKLFEKVIEFENGVIEEYCNIPGVDAVSFGDDWGSQQNLFINPDDWRAWFKPFYCKQFEAVHRHGKHVYFHCCGKINAILDDLIEIGADILNLNQPDLLDLDEMKRYRGRVCFNCPVDHQTVAIRGNAAEIDAYVHRLVDSLAADAGGYIGHIEEYHSVGLSEENYQAICRSFESVRATAYPAQAST